MYAQELEDRTVLTENLVVLSYIAEQSVALPAKDGVNRWRELEAVSFMTIHIHD